MLDLLIFFCETKIKESTPSIFKYFVTDEEEQASLNAKLLYIIIKNIGVFMQN